MRNYQNIETRKFHGHSYYIGYSKGDRFHIYGSHREGWKAIGQNGCSDNYHGDNLKEISEQLEER